MAITSSASGIGRIESILGEEAEDLLGHECTTIARERLHLPGPDFVDRVFTASRPARARAAHAAAASSATAAWPARATSRSCPSTRASSTPAGASFAKNPLYFDPENIVKLAIEGGCNAVASTLGVLGMVARKYAHRIPFMREAQPQRVPDLSRTSSTRSCSRRSSRRADMGAVAVGATIYFGSEESDAADPARSARPSSTPTSWAWPRSSGATCATPPSRPRRRTTTCRPTSPARPTTWGHDRGRHHQAEAAREQRRLPALSTKENPYGKIDKRVYSELTTRQPDRPDPLPGGELLHGPRRPDQLRRRLAATNDFAGSRQDRRHQQARGRHGPHLRPQGLPAADGRGRRAAQRDPGRLPLPEVTVA